MSALAVIGLTTLDQLDGGRTEAGGVPLHALRGLAEVGAVASVATKVAEADRALLAPLRELTSNLAWRPASETAAYSLHYDAGRERRVTIDALGDPWQATELDDWVTAALGPASIVHAGALSAGDFPPETLRQLAARYRVSLDGQGLVRPARVGPVTHEPPASLEVLEHVAVLKLSLHEAAVLGVEPAHASLVQLGVPEVVLTDAERGAWILAAGSFVKITADPVAVPDATGAGDGFIACYLAARVDRASPRASGESAARAVATMLRRRKAEG